MNVSISAGARTGWTGRLWTEITPVYDAIVEHPFITGLVDGTLSTERFVHFISQDTHYLRLYTRTLLALAARAPSAAATQVLAGHAVTAANAETGLHAELMTALGRDAAELEKASVLPTTHAYTSFLVATAFGEDFADGFAAVMPCFWIYAEVGRHLVASGSANPVYQRWIDSYAGETYQHEVDLMLDLTDQIGLGLNETTEPRARSHFSMAARYEWMFWDAAYRLESWPA